MARTDLVHADLTRSVIGAFYEVCRNLQVGFRESVYVAALEFELRARGHEVSREHTVNVYYKQVLIARQRLDLVVDAKVVVEVKSSPVLPPHSRRQLLSYLTSTQLEVGLLLHFCVEPRFYRLVATNGHASAPRPSA